MYLLTLDSQQFKYTWENPIFSFSWIYIALKGGKYPQKPKNNDFSPIFDDKLLYWTMKNQMLHKDILARQSSNTPLSTGDKEKV